MTSDANYMLKALRLAQRGLGNVEPNPIVGAIIVKNGKIIGSGWHKKFGGAHAEINALADCKKRGNNPKGATMYVTLEPCCHYGKTGPCTDALIAAKLKRVVVATIDPSKHANGKGIRQLRKGGITVDIGLCEGQARVFNAPFMKFARTGKPWVTLKWAQSIDGKLVSAKSSGLGHPIREWISSKESRQDAHKLRRQVGAILVGINTVLKDDPLLTPRPSNGKKPIRIVLDNRLRIPLNCKLLTTAKNVPVIIVTQKKMLRTKKAKQIVGRGAKLLDYHQKSKSNLRFLLVQLGKRGIQRLLVEGGPTVIGSFLKENLADEIIMYISPKVLGKGGAADIGTSLINTFSQMRYVNMKRFDDDVKIDGLTANGLKAAGIRRKRL
jgi:diaminohydroxyphosphoribosylaminopyrimidine deaminase/5-amino-6-(5-phosphoribosylamino)uracil reductase